MNFAPTLFTGMSGVLASGGAFEMIDKTEDLGEQGEMPVTKVPIEMMYIQACRVRRISMWRRFAGLGMRPEKVGCW